MNALPDDVTLGELWRGQQAQSAALTTLAAEVRALPDRLVNELARDVDARFVALAKEREAERKLADTELAAVRGDVHLLKQIVYGVVAFVFVALGTAVLSLVLHAPKA